jgi:hypothetical protein
MEIPILGILLLIAYLWISIKFGDCIDANYPNAPKCIGISAEIHPLTAP